MKSKLGLAAAVVALGGCSSLDNSIAKTTADFSATPATVTCWSGGEVIYQTTTRGKVTTGTGDMATFYDVNGNLVEIFADCAFVYDVKPKATVSPSSIPKVSSPQDNIPSTPNSNKRVNPITGR